MSCRGPCKQGRAECEREECRPDSLDLRIASRFLAVVVALVMIMLIATIGAVWSSM